MALLAGVCVPGSLRGQAIDPRAPDAGPIPPSSVAPLLRVVSLHPAATEILVALGAEDLLVARLEGDIRARPELARLPSVGEMLAPDLEVLASVEADLVIAWAGSDLSALRRLVERRGGRVEPIEVERLSHLGPAIGRIGGWVGRAEAAERLADALSASLAAAERMGPVGAARPRVLWVVWSEPIVVAGPSTLMHDLIGVAGGQNAAASLEAAWPRLGMESLVALDADVLVWPEGPGVFPAGELAARAGWRHLGAVEAERVVVVDPERFHDAGPEIGDAALELARRLRAVATP